jgi:hypothetical protein
MASDWFALSALAAILVAAIGVFAIYGSFPFNLVPILALVVIGLLVARVRLHGTAPAENESPPAAG